jgi:hypothetical protein
LICAVLLGCVLGIFHQCLVNRSQTHGHDHVGVFITLG